MKKTKRKILIVVIICLFVCVLSAFGVVFRYKIAHDFSLRHIKLNDVKDIGVTTYNVKYNDRFDFGKTGWYYRSKYIAQIIEDNQTSIICLQEIRPEQYRFFKKFLKGYESVALFRDDTNTAECTPIFFRSDCFELISSYSFWLSDTPDVLSNTWNGNCTRICTSVTLKEKSTSKLFAVFNTHLDHGSKTVREKSVELIKSKIKECNLPCIVTGDMNATPYSSEILSFKEDLDDLADVCGDDSSTFNGGIIGGYEVKYDYIFTSKEFFEVSEYKVIKKTYEDMQVSDHYPVYAKLTLK